MTNDEAVVWLGCEANITAKVKGSKEIDAQRTFVSVEEKIDGANLGISLAPDYTPLFQNRSHFVGVGSGTQWSGLDRWWAAHSQVLTSLLEPRRHVLFGEWMALKHSIHYLRLPAVFVAFDVYDRIEGRFISRERFNVFLEPTGIPTINAIVPERAFCSPSEILPLLETVSIYGAQKRAARSINGIATGADGEKSGKKTAVDKRKVKQHDDHHLREDPVNSESEDLNGGVVEGVYLRVDEGDWLARRCKIVRPDFVQGITTHWSKMDIVKNKVAYW
mmetsp:Transcript_47332/g.95405  ORF Transcript_47332/g.95405 Transcript_47332/m.95405 type:complete len:276 (-) Transcript_47332:220-1047(-)